ncbi:MAG: hypothetical protein IKS01_02400 [Paludibacteraceae bacterium]|nr:hypothetical protein [Paludibacteraceae bacterium]
MVNKQVSEVRRQRTASVRRHKVSGTLRLQIQKKQSDEARNPVCPLNVDAVILNPL